MNSQATSNNSMDITGSEAEVHSSSSGSKIVGFLKGPTGRVILLFGGYKILVLGLALACALLQPAAFSLGSYQANFHWPENKKPGLAERFMTWDGEHYLYLSANGYKADSMSDAFYPLWPALIGAGAKLTSGHALIVALFLSNLFSFVAWLLLYQLVARIHGKECAHCALLLLIAYPGSLFFQFPYSESLFLLLIVLFFMGIFREKFRLVALTGFLLPLTRAVGVFSLLPLGWYLFEKAVENRKSNASSFSMVAFISSTLKNGVWLACAAPLLGYASYFIIMNAFTGNPMSGFEAQRDYLNQPSVMNILNLPGFASAFFNVGWHHGMADSPIDRAFFVVFLICLPLIWRLNKLYFFYALGSGLIPAMSNWFFSYTRLLVLCFPLFIVLGKKLSERKNRLLLKYVVTVLGIIQIMFVIKHVNFRWAG